MENKLLENNQNELETKKKLMKEIDYYTKLLETTIGGNDKALFSMLIGRLNKTFYGYNKTELKKVFKENNINISAKDSILTKFDITHLQMQKYFIIKLGALLERNDPQTTEDYFRLAHKAGDLGRKYFIDEYEEEPLHNLLNIQNVQLRIDNIIFTEKGITEKADLKETKTMEVKELKITTNEDKEQEIEKLQESREEITKGLSKIGTIRNPQGAANNLYNELIGKIYKTKGVKKAIDLKEKLEDTLNIEIKSLEELLPVADLTEINKTLKMLNNYIKSKEGISTRQTVSNIYEKNHDLATIATERIIDRLKEENPEVKKITPYTNLKKHVRTLK